MEAGEYGLTRGACFIARRPEVVAVAGLLWISWCVLGEAGLGVLFFIAFIRTPTACWKYEAALPHLPLHEYRLRERYEADIHKARIYGSGQKCSNAWDVFRHMPLRGGC